MGASLVSRLPKRSVQLVMGIAMLFAVVLIIAKTIGWLPSGGDSYGLSGGFFVRGLLGNFVFGALMTIGVGAYAPIMVMVSLLGMNTKSAFPLMMGSCAFLMPVASYRFIQSGKYDHKAAIGLTLFGLPGVAVAACLVDATKIAAMSYHKSKFDCCQNRPNNVRKNVDFSLMFAHQSNECTAHSSLRL